MSIKEEDNKIFKDYVVQKVQSIKVTRKHFLSKRENINRRHLGVAAQLLIHLRINGRD